MNYSVCVSSVYQGLPLVEGMRRVAALGFQVYEFWGWRGEDLDAVDRVRRECGLRTKAFCPNFVPLNVPERRGEYLARLREDLAAAQKLGAEMLLAQVGQALPDVSRDRQRESIVAGLKACAPLLEDAGVTLAVEPLNDLVDHKGYYLTRSGEGLDIVREVDSPNVRLVFDAYHQQISEGNLIVNLTADIGKICHIHIAGNPGRHEPLVNSEVNYPAVLRAAKQAGYAGDVGLEYIPLGDPDESLRQILREMPL